VERARDLSSICGLIQMRAYVLNVIFLLKRDELAISIIIR